MTEALLVALGAVLLAVLSWWRRPPGPPSVVAPPPEGEGQARAVERHERATEPLREVAAEADADARSEGLARLVDR